MTTRKEASGRRRLGRGLGSLISAPAQVDVSVASAPKPPAGKASPEPGLRRLAIGSIRANPHQPRRHFDEKALDALAASISSAGVMQPIVVREHPGGFELVAGERRWRAAQRAGLDEIPAIVRSADDRQAAELSLIENLQREDLNPIERAQAFRRLIDEFDLKHQQVGEIVGMDRSTVTNHLRLLELSEDIQEVVRLGMLSLGHARALLALSDPDVRRRIALKAAREGWSVRATEREVARRSVASDGAHDEAPAPASVSPRRAHLADLERRLGEHLGTKTRIRPGKKKGSGTIVVEFYDFTQFEGLMDRLGFSAEAGG